MADPQNTVGDLLGKFGISIGDSESQRQDMIRRLKTVKDPEERDRLIWALSGQRKEETGYRPSPAFGRRPKTDKMRAPASSYPGPFAGTSGEPAPGPAPQNPTTPEAGPQLRLGNVLNYIIPILFVFFGVSNIAKAVEAFRAGAEKEEVLVQLMIGIGFIIFAAMSLFSRKMKKVKERSQGRAR